jgi:N-carbamoyl-L-amino-acid hydrolase
MHRREFLLSLPALWAASSGLRIDGARLNRRLAELSRFGRTEAGGVSRVAYSDADRDARATVLSWMREAGLETRVDAAGNLLGRLPGRDQSLPPILFGSHIDSVPDGGNYDGPVGSLGAIEVAARFSESGVTTRHPLEVAIFQNEENGKIGSRAMAGELAASELDLPTYTERTVREGIAFLGGDPARIDEARRKPGEIAAFLELHVEQGALLDRGDVEIGVVEGIVGIERWRVTVEGFANHAGTTPMGERRDALLTAARLVELVHRIASETPGRQVATVGRIQAYPGAPNVIPGRVELSLEIRDLDMAKIESLFGRIEAESRAIAASNRTEARFERYYESRSAASDPRLMKVVEESARSLSCSTLALPSGAGHDAQSMALLAPMGMIFVPSAQGISHSPREYTAPEDVERGANVLLRSVLAVDALALV